MPWTCPECSASLKDDAFRCACGAEKSRWTLAGGTTRQFVVTRKRFELTVGSVVRSLPPDHPAWKDERFAEPPWALALSGAALRDDLRRGLRPASEGVLLLRAPGAEAAKATLTLNYAQDSARDVGIDLAPVEGGLEARVALVVDPGDLDWEGHVVVDVSEPSAQGYVPSVDLECQGRRFELPLRPAGWVVSARFVEACGKKPAAGLTYTFRGHEDETGPEGEVEIQGVEPGDHCLEFAGGRVWVSAVNDPGLVGAVRLPWLVGDRDASAEAVSEATTVLSEEDLWARLVGARPADEELEDDEEEEDDGEDSPPEIHGAVEDPEEDRLHPTDAEGEHER